MGKKRVLLLADEVDTRAEKYYPEVIQAPHLTGFMLKLFVKLVEAPMIGSLIIGQLKKQNKMAEILRNTVIRETPMFKPEFPPQGSIRIPFALCGVVGLKSTYGRTDMKGSLCDAGTVEIIGPLASIVEDVMLVYAAISGSSPADIICFKTFVFCLKSSLIWTVNALQRS